MPTIARRGRKFLARVRLHGRKPISKMFVTELAALQWAKVKELQIRSGHEGSKYAGLAGQLYRFYDEDGRLLYVGKSTNFIMRLGYHMLAKKWFKDIALVSIDHYATVWELDSAERIAIRTEHPSHNIVGVGNKFRDAIVKGAHAKKLDKAVAGMSRWMRVV